MGHSRWTAGARELARQFWDTDPGFTLVMTSLGALGGAFFRGGLVRKVVTAYSGNSFPTYTPNPIFRQAYESGEVEVEHWSILTLSQRLEAAARGLPAAVTGSLVGSSMADNDAFTGRRLAVRAARPARAARARCRVGPRRSGRPGRQPRVLRAVARRALGCLGGPAGRRGDGRAGARRRRGPRASGPHPGPSCAGGRRGAVRRAPGRLLRAGPARAQLRRGHRALERGGRRRGTRRVRPLCRGVGARARRRTRSISPGRRGTVAMARRPVRPDVVEGRRGRHADRRGPPR